MCRSSRDREDNGNLGIPEFVWWNREFILCEGYKCSFSTAVCWVFPPSMTPEFELIQNKPFGHPRTYRRPLQCWEVGIKGLKKPRSVPLIASNFDLNRDDRLLLNVYAIVTHTYNTNSTGSPMFCYGYMYNCILCSLCAPCVACVFCDPWIYCGFVTSGTCPEPQSSPFLAPLLALKVSLRKMLFQSSIPYYNKTASAVGSSAWGRNLMILKQLRKSRKS